MCEWSVGVVRGDTSADAGQQDTLRTWACRRAGAGPLPLETPVAAAAAAGRTVRETLPF